MLEVMFKTNKLEHLHIYTEENKNIVSSMTISSKIEYLRYFYIINNDRVDITLDISQEYPKKLQVYYIQYAVYHIGDIQGPKDKVT